MVFDIHQLLVGNVIRDGLHPTRLNIAKNNQQKKKAAQARPPKRNPVTMPQKKQSGPRNPMTPLRTVDTIARSLIRGLPTGARGGRLSDYVHCRLNPFQGSGKAAIPDGGNDGFVVNDLYSFDTIAMNGNTNFMIQTFPTLPCSAGITFAPLSTPVPLQVNGVNFTAPPSLDSSVSGGGIYPLSVPTVYNNIGNPIRPGNRINDVYSTANLRMIAMGYRLIYTGPAYDCSGSITVTPSSVSLSPGGVTQSTAASATLPGFATLNAAQISVGNVTRGTACLSWDGTISNSFVSQSVTFRPEQGILFVPKHRSKDFKVQPYSDVPMGLIFNSSLVDTGNLTANAYAGLLTTNNTTLGSSTYAGGICWYDNDWSSVTVVASGINPDASFRWETVYCMEIAPQPTSVLSAFTRKVEAPSISHIEAAQKLTNDAPIATSMESSMMNGR